jgi:tripartite-type tricarboxylate transporter receptor subunit TctC
VDRGGEDEERGVARRAARRGGSMSVRLAFAALFAGAALAAAGAPLAAAGAPPEYPARSVKLIVADAPKSAADLVARVLAVEVAKTLKKPVVVENRPGGGGRIAAQAVARARPDGYTLLFAPNAVFTIEPYAHPVKAFDALRDLEPVVAVGNAPFFLAVPRSMTVNSAPELIGNARLRAGGMLYTTPPAGSMQRVAMEAIANLAGIRWQHIAGTTVAQAAKDLAANIVQVYVDILPVIQPIADAEKAKILAVTSEKRYPSLPDVVSIGEVLPGWTEVSLVQGLYAPRATPEAIVARWNADVNLALAVRPVLKQLFISGFMPAGGTPADLKARLAREYEDVGHVAKAAGIGTP